MKKFFTLSALTALSFSTAAYAEQATSAPELQGGITVSLGTMWVVPSVANDDYGFISSANNDGSSSAILNVDPDYEWGLLASLGYVFDNTANMVELSYHGLFDASSSSSASLADTESNWLAPRLIKLQPTPNFNQAKSTLEFEHHSVDLMFSQFMNLGHHTQVRFSAGASYVDYEQKQSSDFSNSNVPFDEFHHNETSKTDYSGFGPRVGIDGRYDFGQGFGILAGGSAAYYIGDLDTRFNAAFKRDVQAFSGQVKNSKSDHGVTNVRGNIGIDYVYFFDNDERSTVGIELGYRVDWYDEMVGEIDPLFITAGNTELYMDGRFDTTSVMFSGPYLLVKGAF